MYFIIIILVAYTLQEKFMSFVDLFQKDSIKIKAAKIIVEAFCK